MSPPGSLRMVSQYPGHAWWGICVAVLNEVSGAYLGTGPLRDPAYAALAQHRFELLTPTASLGALHNLRDVADGHADVGLTTPTGTAVMATRGTGPYDRALAGLRAIAAYPHDDFLIFLADARYGAGTLTDFLALDAPRTVVTGRGSRTGDWDVLTYCVDEVMRRHGATLTDLAAQEGSSVTFGGPTRVGGRLLLDGEADALFHEAQNQPIWREIAETREVVALRLERHLIDGLATDLGVRVREIPAGHPVSPHAPVPTLDFSGWLMFVHERMPDEQAYALAMACDRTRPEVEALANEGAIITPIDAAYLFNETGIPLHDGAKRYATEMGHVS